MSAIEPPAPSGLTQPLPDHAPQTAMLLAAGLGTRMRSVSETIPKPLIEVAGKALIDYALDRFANAGVSRAVVNVHHLADQVERHLASRTRPSIQISDERGQLLETGGGLKQALPLLGSGPVFCTNTDAILVDGSTEACTALAGGWCRDEMDALLLLCPTENTSGYGGSGDFFLKPDGRIDFRGDASAAPFVFTGLQIISTDLINAGPDGPFSTKVLWQKALASKRLFGIAYDGQWMHVGDADGLAAAQERLIGAT